MNTPEPEEKSTNSSDNNNASRKRERLTGFELWGGYMAAKKEKLSAQYQAQKPQTANNEVSVIFKGVAIFINGYTRPPAEELKHLMLSHGGIYHYYYSPSRTTHIIATNLPDSKVKNLKGEKVVSPEWITDSIEAGKLLPYYSYLLYTPEKTQGQLTLDSKRMNITNTENACSTIDNNISSVLEGAYIPNGKDKCGTICLNSEQVHQSFDKYKSTEANQIVAPVPSCSAVENLQIDSVAQTFSILQDTIKLSDSINHEGNPPMKAGDPNYLSEFYSHSRLHHISTAGQELKQYIQQLVKTQKGLEFAGREKLRSLKGTDYPEHKFLTSQDELNVGNVDNGPSNQWLSAPTFSSVSKNNRNTMDNKVIMHIDMDCFFVSVGLRKHPELRGHPVVVTHSKGKRVAAQPGSDINYEANYYNRKMQHKLQGANSTFDDDDEESDCKRPIHVKDMQDFGSLSEIACCNYEARKAGLHNGMFLGKAMKLCPNLKTIPYDFDGYTEVSKQLYDIVSSYSLDIEAISCDELYIDCLELLQDTGVSPLQFASVLRAEIAEVTNCTASTGLGNNMLLARLATRVAKPNGQHFLPENEVEDFIKKQKVKDLPGIGYSTCAKLEHLGVVTCADLQAWPLEKLQKEFGPKNGQNLYYHCRGRDDKEVTLEKERKSVSAEINYGIRFQEDKDVFKFLNELALEVHQRLKKIGKKGKSLTLKLKIRKEDAPKETAKFMGHGVCDSISKSILLKSATDDPTIIGNQCCQIIQNMKLNPEDYRGVGIQITKLESSSDEGPVTKTMEYFLSNSTGNNNENFVESLPSMPTNDGIQTERKETTSSPGKPTKTVKDFFTNANGGSCSSSTRPSIQEVELDESFLNALPEDIRKEVLQMYGKKQKSPVKTTFGPTFKKSPKQNKNAPSKRGRKRKFQKPSPKKLLKTNTNKLYPIFPLAASSIAAKLPANQVEQSSKTQLCGVASLDGVRDLVKEWAQSSEAPREDDADQFKDYLLALIDEKDLEKVDLLLKYFYRLAQGLNILWQEAYLTVLSYVQQKMLQEFGYMLKVNCEF